MNYVKSFLIITMLLGVGYSQCNESNWEEYYPEMEGCDLEGVDLSGAYFYLTNLTNTIWDECGITDENDDGYDDTSYDAGYVDGANDVLDVVTLVNNILNP